VQAGVAFPHFGETGQRGTESRMNEIKRPQSTPKWREIDALRHQTVGQLRVKYLEVFRRESHSNNQKFLVRRIAWRLQANAEGGLSERARQRAVDLADEADLRIRAPQSFLKELARENRDPRLPAVGTCLTREFQGRTLSVEVLEKGFRYQEQVYRSLSAVARQVSGVQWNGFAFFSLPVNVGRRHES
jgi:Protein of unknown function (DUF2924)